MVPWKTAATAVGALAAVWLDQTGYGPTMMGEARPDAAKATKTMKCFMVGDGVLDVIPWHKKDRIERIDETVREGGRDLLGAGRRSYVCREIRAAGWAQIRPMVL